MTLTPAQEVAQKLAQLETHSHAQQPGANCCAASEYLPDRAVAYVVDQRVQYADYFGKLPVAVIIPAYNEAERITATVQAALAIAGVERVVVVDDGSTDNTAKIAKRAGAEVISKPHKRGKGAAMARAWLICVSLPSRVRTICCCLSTATWALVPRLARC